MDHEEDRRIRYMKYLLKIKKYLEEKEKYWFIFILLLIFLQVINIDILSSWMPEWLSVLTSLIIYSIAMCYIGVLYIIVKEKVKCYLELQNTQQTEAIKEDLCDKLQESIKTILANYEDKHVSLLGRVDELGEQIVNEGQERKKHIDTSCEVVLEKIEYAQEQVDESFNKRIESLVEAERNDTEKLLRELQLLNSTGESQIHALSELMKLLQTQIDEKFTEHAEQMTLKFAEVDLHEEKRGQAVELKLKELVEQIVLEGEKKKQQIDILNQAILSQLQQTKDDLEVTFGKQADRIIENETKDAQNITESLHMIETTVKSQIHEIGEAQILLKTRIEEGFADQTDQIVSKFAEVDARNEVREKEVTHSLIKIAEQIVIEGEEKQKQIEEVHQSILLKLEKSQEMFQENIDGLANRIVEVEGVVLRESCKMLDVMDENAEKNSADYNRVYNQVADFSKNTKTILHQVKKDVLQSHEDLWQECREEINEINEQVVNITKEREMNRKVAETYRQYQLVTLERLDKLQLQITNLDALSILLKNVVNQQGGISTKSVDTTNEPNRVEKIQDIESGMTVFNSYKAGKLVMSEMFKGEQKVYEVTYGKGGEVTHSKNYDSEGAVITELSYYPNGQVKERKEQIKVNGTNKIVVSKFDQSGKKMK